MQRPKIIAVNTDLTHQFDRIEVKYVNRHGMQKDLIFTLEDTGIHIGGKVLIGERIAAHEIARNSVKITHDDA